MKIDVLGLGNPLMDITIPIEEDILKQLNLEKGGMHLITPEQAETLTTLLNTDKIQMTPAGSCANTIMGLATLNNITQFIGKVGQDTIAATYAEKMNSLNIIPQLIAGEAKTGTSFCLITPDSERTMATLLGAAILLNETDIQTQNIPQATYLYLTGYVLEDPNLRKAALKTIHHCKAQGTKIAVDLADPHLIQRAKQTLIEIIQEHVDILFLNQEEAEAFTGIEEPQKAAQALSAMTDIAVVKLGKKGCIISTKEISTPVAGFTVQQKDTTGAGDLFAAGFLHGLLKNLPLKQCGTIANFMGAKTVEQYGAFPKQSYLDEINQLIQAPTTLNTYKETRPWGNFEQFSQNQLSTVKFLNIKEGEQLSLQYHKKRDEFWKVLEGTPTIIIGETTHQAAPGQHYFVPLKTKHTIITTTTPVKILEISFGHYDENDNIRVEDPYKRV